MYEQLKDILPTFVVSICVAFVMWMISWLKFSIYLMLPTQLLLGIALAFLIYRKMKLEEYLEVKQIILSIINRK